jgi:hypothetical protein
MEAVDILAARVRVCYGEDETLFTLLVPESPSLSPAPPAEVHISVQTDTNPFLDLLLLRRSLDKMWLYLM